MAERGYRDAACVALSAALAVTLYLFWSWAGGHLGFPLDDAWIHQAYARNLVEYGQWAFVPGQPSAGSTAPLWTLLLSVGYVLGAPFRIWTYGLGGLCLPGTAFLAARLARQWFPDQPSAPLLVGLACVLEWHLVWAAVSGMETLLFTMLVLALWDQISGRSVRAFFLAGLLGGALILTRPEGILAVGLAAGAWLGLGLRGWLRPQVTPGGRSYAAGVVLLTAGTVLLVAPYLLLNFRLSGTPWPNTFYAKQTEYAGLLAQPFWLRLWRVGSAPLVGAQALLLPGVFWTMWGAGRRCRQSPAGFRLMEWLPLTWAAATVGVYALRLPVTYQHGRYLIPIIPLLLIYGIGGGLSIQSHIRSLKVRRRGEAFERALRVGLSVWGLSAALLFVAFLALGARAYATDVGIIEEEMVAVAQWLNAHTRPDALVAVHDIGAVGYFARRPLLDLAGLVNPEVIPFIRDEERLLEWLRQQGAEYLVTFPSWYPTLSAAPQFEEVYRTNAEVTRAQGGENMVVYALRWARGH